MWLLECSFNALRIFAGGPSIKNADHCKQPKVGWSYLGLKKLESPCSVACLVVQAYATQPAIF